MMKLANTHQPGGNTTESTKEEVEQEFQRGTIPSKVPAPEEKGEGWLPISSDSLAQDIAVFCKENDGDVAYTDEGHLYEQSSIEATSEKLEVAFNPSKKQTSVETYPSISNDLEMCDSSRLNLVHNGFAESGDEVFMKVEGVSNGLFIMCCGIHSLCLFLMEISMWKFQTRFQIAAASFGVPTTPLLQTLGKEEPFGDKDSVKDEEEESQLGEVECIKEVLLEEVSEVTKKGGNDQGRGEEAVLKPEANPTQRVTVSHQRSNKTSRLAKAKRVVRLKPQGGEIPLKVPVTESKGEG